MTRTAPLLALATVLVAPSMGLAKKPAPAAWDADDPSTLQMTEDIQVLFHATQDAWKMGTPKTLFYVDRLVNQAYPDKLGVPADQLDFKIVAHDAPVYWFLDDAGWKASSHKHHAAARDANPFKELIAGLIEAGVDIEVCAVTMKSHGYTEDMLLPGVQITPAGLPRVIDLQRMGFQRLALE